MKSPSSKWLDLLLRVAFTAPLMTLTLNIPAVAQDRPQLTTFTVPAPPVRSMAEMVQALIAQPSPSVGVIPFLPTMDPAEYKARKALAALGGAPRPARPLAAAPLAPPTLTGDNCFGMDQQNAGGTYPPDADGAVGTTQYVHIVNQRIVVWGKTFGPPTGCPNLLLNLSLAAFFNYPTQLLVDPRVVFDPALNRWVVTAEAAPESPTVQRQFVAVSVNADATAGFFIYNFNITPFIGGGFWDFPQLGMDRDTIILTGDVFSADQTMFLGSTTAFLAKASMYSGLPAGACFFSGGPLTVSGFAPPLVLDLNPSTFTVGAPAGPANFLRLVEWRRSNPDISCPTVLNVTDIPVDRYDLPPAAPQPGTTKVLDTSDNRFQNRSTQVGNALWQVHTIGPGSPTPRFYKINTLFATIDQVGVFFATGTSADFNPAIAANASNDIFVTWSSTDAINGTNPQLLFGGKQDLDPPSSIRGGVVTTSQVPLINNPQDPMNPDLQRWGDYSAVSIDPLNPRLGWSVNELVTCATDPFCGGNEWIVLFYTASIP